MCLTSKAIIGMNVKDILQGESSAEKVSGGRVDNTLRLAGRAGGIQDEERVLGRHRLRRAVRRNLGALFVPPDISTLLHRNFCASPSKDENMLGDRALLQRSVDDSLGCDCLSASFGLVGRDENLGLAVIDSVS